MTTPYQNAMRDLAPHLIRREARASTRLDDCTQNEEEPMSPTPNDYKEVFEPEIDDYERLSAKLAQALAEKDRAVAQLAAITKSLSRWFRHTDECRKSWEMGNAPCICGLNDAIDTLPAEAERTVAIVKAADAYCRHWNTCRPPMQCTELSRCGHAGELFDKLLTAVSGEEKR